MFSLFKSKDLIEKENRVTEIGKMLFQQIDEVRKQVRKGQLSESVFNERINSMFAAGYLIGYVDEHLSEMFTDEKSKSKYAKRILEGIFPGTGVKLVQSKLAARRLGETINDASTMIKCHNFDFGMSTARYEVAKYLLNRVSKPNKLEQYLLTGDEPRE